MFSANEDTFEKAAKCFGRTLDSLNEDVETIKNWFKTQPHLPELMGDNNIKNFLILNKCSVEKTKQKIDNYYTMRSLISDFYDNRNPKLSCMRDILDTQYCVTLPELFEDMYRVFFYKAKEMNTFIVREIVMTFINIAEIRLHEDCMVGELYIFDMKNVSLNDIIKITPTLLAKSFAIHEKVFSMRVRAMHFINSPSYINRLFTILKAILKPKIFSRIHIHEDETILKEVLSKNNIPKDYGGDGPSLEELQDALKKKFDEYQNRYNKLDVMKVDESLRPQKLDNDEILGFHGNFKKLSVD